MLKALRTVVIIVGWVTKQTSDTSLHLPKTWFEGITGTPSNLRKSNTPTLLILR
jgi:hypothetical protein